MCYLKGIYDLYKWYLKGDNFILFGFFDINLIRVLVNRKSILDMVYILWFLFSFLGFKKINLCCFIYY